MSTRQTGSNFDANTSMEIEKGLYLTKMFMPDFVETLGSWFNLIMIVLGWLTFTAEVFFRHSFGERYMSWVRFYFSVAVLSPFLFFPALFGGSSLAVFLGLTCYVLFFIHRFVIWRRNERGERWHSMSFGVSWFERLIPLLKDAKFYPWVQRHIDDWTLYRWVEPLTAIILSRILGIVDGAVGVYLLWAGIGMLVNHNLVYNRQRSVYLDISDAQIAQANYQAAFAGTPKQQTAGFTVVPLPALAQHFIEERATESAIAATVAETVRPAELPATGPVAVLGPNISATVAETVGSNGSAPA